MNYKRLSRSAASSAAKRRHAQREKTPVATVQAAAHTTSTGMGAIGITPQASTQELRRGTKRPKPGERTNCAG